MKLDNENIGGHCYTFTLVWVGMPRYLFKSTRLAAVWAGMANARLPALNHQLGMARSTRCWLVCVERLHNVIWEQRSTVWGLAKNAISATYILHKLSLPLQHIHTVQIH